MLMGHTQIKSGLESPIPSNIAWDCKVPSYSVVPAYETYNTERHTSILPDKRLCTLASYPALETESDQLKHTHIYPILSQESVRKRVFSVFIDYRKAFDSIYRLLLWQTQL